MRIQIIIIEMYENVFEFGFAPKKVDFKRIQKL